MVGATVSTEGVTAEAGSGPDGGAEPLLEVVDPRPVATRQLSDVPIASVGVVGETAGGAAPPAAVDRPADAADSLFGSDGSAPQPHGSAAFAATDLDAFAAALAIAERVAIDTETVLPEHVATTGSGNARGDRSQTGALRVLSAATLNPDGSEQAWVVDASAVNATDLAAALAEVTADGWNASFDERVLAEALGPRCSVRWWDAMVADALLHQGKTGFGFFHPLAWAVEWYLGLELTGKGSTQLSYRQHGPLTAEQVRYAAHDAVATLWVGGAIRQQLAEAGLERVCELEQGARPFLAAMERAGLPFDSVGWEQQLAEARQQRTDLRATLAELTGGGQAGLFSSELEPTFNPDSEQQVREVLNARAADQVAAYTQAEFGASRPLGRTDSLSAAVLTRIGGPIADTLLAYRDVNKLLSTYGEGLRDHVGADGRLHPSYLQVVGTNTGRLASRRPNAQNLTPKVKPFIRAPAGRRFVYSDLSQAELRFAAQVSGDEALTAAFKAGSDIHFSTAERMFGTDMRALRDTDPKAYELMRTKAKRINFGILYGQRGGGLGRGLSEAGVPTTTAEADELIDAYLAAYPQLATWVNGRDRFIAELAHGEHDVDWDATLRLDAWWPQVDAARRHLREARPRHHSAEEVHAGLVAGELSVAQTAWCLQFAAPVVLDGAGQPFGFTSRTEAGRRQQFTIATDGVLGEAALVVATSHRPQPRALWREVLRQAGEQVGLAGGGASSGGGASAAQQRAEAAKVLERRELRRSLLALVAEEMGVDAQQFALRKALASRIERLANAYRNAPIQGGVADVMLEAYGLLADRLAPFNRAVGVQTVHDSVVVECDEADTAAVAQVVHATMNEAMAAWCTSVPTAVDTDIRTSLDETDVLSRI